MDSGQLDKGHSPLAVMPVLLGPSEVLPASPKAAAGQRAVPSHAGAATVSDLALLWVGTWQPGAVQWSLIFSYY